MRNISKEGLLLLGAVLFSAVVVSFWQFLPPFASKAIINYEDIAKATPFPSGGNMYALLDDKKILASSQGTVIKIEDIWLHLKLNNGKKVKLPFPENIVIYKKKDLDDFDAGKHFSTLPQLSKNDILIGAQVSYSYPVDKNSSPSIVVY